MSSNFISIRLLTQVSPETHCWHDVQILEVKPIQEIGPGSLVHFFFESATNKRRFFLLRISDGWIHLKIHSKNYAKDIINKNHPKIHTFWVLLNSRLNNFDFFWRFWLAFKKSTNQPILGGHDDSNHLNLSVLGSPFSAAFSPF